MCVCVEGHDDGLKVFFDVLESLTRGCAIAVHEGFLAKWRPKERVQMTSNDILAKIVEDLQFIGRQLGSILVVLILTFHA